MRMRQNISSETGILNINGSRAGLFQNETAVCMLTRGFNSEGLCKALCGRVGCAIL